MQEYVKGQALIKLNSLVEERATGALQVLIDRGSWKQARAYRDLLHCFPELCLSP